VSGYAMQTEHFRKSENTMHLKRYTDVDAFYQAAGEFLLRHEAENCLIVGICTALRENIKAYGTIPPYFVTVADDVGIIAAAIMTPPHKLVLSYSDIPEALEMIAVDAIAANGLLPGVLGPSSLSKRFAMHWHELTDQPVELGMSQRIYKLEKVKHPSAVPGRMRRVVEEDRTTILRWLFDFHQEAVGGKLQENPFEKQFNSALEGKIRRYFVWENSAGEPVSFAGCTGPTQNGLRIGPVYTPPEQRKRGYASALVAALSQLILDEGRSFCFLFTDLANPTSNHIYQEIGYTPVIDVDEFVFGTHD
jgi:Predicted acetyltransferase